MADIKLVVLARDNLAGVLGAVHAATGILPRFEKEALLSQVVPLENRSFQKVAIHLGAPPEEMQARIRDALIAEADSLAAYALVPAQGIKIRVAVFDTDSTFINQEVIDEIAAYAGVKKEVAEITERAMQGELDFNEALRERVLLLKNLPETILPEIRRNKLSFTSGAPEFAAWLHAQGAATYLLSGGFSFFTSAFCRELSLTGQFANELEIVDGRLTGKTVGAIVNRERKAALLKELAAKHGAPLPATIAVGDGANDIDMAKTSGLGIAFCAKPALLKETFAAVFERDLRLIEYLIHP